MAMRTQHSLCNCAFGLTEDRSNPTFFYWRANECGNVRSHFVKSGGLKPISPSEPDDFFIACASFEPRSKWLTGCMTSYRVRKSALYVNREFQHLGTTSANCSEMGQALNAVSEKYTGVKVGAWEDAAVQFRVLRELIAPNGIDNAPLRITLDITTFNREALLACMSIVRWVYPKGILRLIYVSPQEYNPAGRAALQKIAGGGSIHAFVILLWFRSMYGCLGGSEK